jgi:hypothetical protein
MAYSEVSLLVWCVAGIQIAGVASAWLARLTEGSPKQSPCQWLFVALLFAVGAITMLTIALGPRYWLASGATLSVMVLGAIWDFRAHTPRDVFERSF